MSEDKNEPTGEDVSLEAAAECCAEAAKAADEREEETVEWAELVETPVTSMNLSTFKDRVGEKFSVQIATKALDLELVEVHSMASAASLDDAAPASREHFAITFQESDPTITLTDGIYRLEHADLGQFEVYLEEVTAPNADGSAAEDQRYEAVFS
jgi:hypothetical protein